jgi:hypothetical protein
MELHAIATRYAYRQAKVERNSDDLVRAGARVDCGYWEAANVALRNLL